MRIRMISLSGEAPRYATQGAAGMDLKAFTQDPIVLQPMERKLIPTGLFLEIPAGYEGQVRARSGLAIKHGIGLVNSVGTIDADYRGEVKVPMINFGSEDFVINNGDRIAQLVIAKCEQVEIELTDVLSESGRGAGGFGHTGVTD